MPYITKEAKERIQNERNINTAGELNFLLTSLCRQYQAQHGTSYQTMNDILGALQGCSIEYYRRVVAPYENNKIEQNGDVY